LVCAEFRRSRVSGSPAWAPSTGPNRCWHARQGLDGWHAPCQWHHVDQKDKLFGGERQSDVDDTLEGRSQMRAVFRRWCVSPVVVVVVVVLLLQGRPLGADDAGGGSGPREGIPGFRVFECVRLQAGETEMFSKDAGAGRYWRLEPTKVLNGRVSPQDPPRRTNLASLAWNQPTCLTRQGNRSFGSQDGRPRAHLACAIPGWRPGTLQPQRLPRIDRAPAPGPRL
jgi:hypothetical protein